MRLVLRPIIAVMVVIVGMLVDNSTLVSVRRPDGRPVTSDWTRPIPFNLEIWGWWQSWAKTKTMTMQQISLMKALGVQIVIWTPGEWAENETTPGQYRLNPEVRRVANEIAASDMKMVLLLFRKNNLYRNPLDAAAFARYCGWMATTFRGMPVAAYQIWNEPSNFDVREYYGGAWNGRGACSLGKQVLRHGREGRAGDQASRSQVRRSRQASKDHHSSMPWKRLPQNLPTSMAYHSILIRVKLPPERVPWGGAEIYLRDGVSVADSEGSLVSTLNIQGNVDADRYLEAAAPGLGYGIRISDLRPVQPSRAFRMCIRRDPGSLPCSRTDSGFIERCQSMGSL